MCEPKSASAPPGELLAGAREDLSCKSMYAPRVAMQAKFGTFLGRPDRLRGVSSLSITNISSEHFLGLTAGIPGPGSGIRRRLFSATRTPGRARTPATSEDDRCHCSYNGIEYLQLWDYWSNLRRR
jgi:hypothetical protein